MTMNDESKNNENVPLEDHSSGVGAKQGRRTKRILLIVGGLSVMAAIIFVISRDVEPSPYTASVRTHSIARGDLLVTITEQGTLESSNNSELKCKVRGDSTIIEVVESGTEVKEGDVLLRLDTLRIEEEIDERTMYVHLTTSGVASAQAEFTRAELAVSEYENGQFVAALAGLETSLAIARSRLSTTQNMLDHAQRMHASKYVSDLEMEERKFALAQAELVVELAESRIDNLKEYSKDQQLVQRIGDKNAAQATLNAEQERLEADEQRLLRAQEEYECCVVRAERDGVVIYPSARAWENVPDIEEGATVHKDQVLLLMPDMTQMQVKVGVHESIVDQIHEGYEAIITLPDRTLIGRVDSVAPIAKPAGWWTGNVVKYDAIVELPSVEGLKPGMSAEVEIVMARHEDVFLAPLSAVLELDDEFVCWIQKPEGPQRRTIEIGDSDEMFIIVKNGLDEGDEVVLEPLTCIEEAQNAALREISDGGISAEPWDEEVGNQLQPLTNEHE
jgi:HlyD family secretion protein